MIYHSHGVNYIRTGSCRQCGACEKETCPHFSMEGDVSVCAVHDKKGQFCKSCTEDKSGYWYNPKRQINHQECADFPDNPFVRVVREGICGFKFKPETEADRKKHETLMAAWKK